MLKMSEIKNLDKGMIDSKLDKLRVDLFNMKMLKSTSGLEKPHKIKVAKKDIARLLTVKNMSREK